MPTWQRASLAYRLSVRLVRAFLVAWAVALGWVGVAVVCRVPRALVEFVALSVVVAGSLAFLVGIGAQFFVPDAKRAQQRSGAAGLMFYRDVFAGIPAYEPSGRELPRMRWK